MAVAPNRTVARLSFRRENPALPGDPLLDHGLEARVVRVTPKIAAEWLDANTRNRRKKPKKIDQYGRDMARGTWPLTGQTIVFDRNGILVDGQNRLQACADSGAPFLSVVVWGVAPDAFRRMDSGTPRSFADVLGIEGEIDNRVLAAVVPLIWRHERRAPLSDANVSATNDEKYDCLERHPEVRSSVQWRRVPRELALTPSAAVFAHYILSRLDADMADQFFAALYSGDSLSSRNPIGVLRKQLIRYRLSMEGRGASVPKLVAWVFRAWNAWVKGQEPTHLKWTPDMAFPIPVDPHE